MVVKVKYCLPLVPSTKYSMNAETPIPVGNIPPLNFLGGPKNHGNSGNTNTSWEPEILVAVVTEVGVPVEKYLVYVI